MSKYKTIDVWNHCFGNAQEVYDYAGRLIEEAGLKGFNVGDAEVSQKHANFIINTGNAKGSEIKELILKIQKTVKEKFDIELKAEQEFVE